VTFLLLFLRWDRSQKHDQPKVRSSSYKSSIGRLKMEAFQFKFKHFVRDVHICEASGTSKLCIIFFRPPIYLPLLGTHAKERMAPNHLSRDFMCNPRNIYPLAARRQWVFHMILLFIYLRRGHIWTDIKIQKEAIYPLSPAASNSASTRKDVRLRSPGRSS
jgi:hypothetical protein